jgi:hypothetical protein
VRVSDSLEEFKESVNNPENRRKWFFEDLAQSLSEQGFHLSKGKCLGYERPIVFSESTTTADNVYVADSFLGDIHLQMRDVPDG